MSEWDDDMDYREDSEEESSESDIPQSMQRDRAQWVVENYDELVEIYEVFKKVGVLTFGSAFFQSGGIDRFAKFCYKYTSPGGA